MENPSPVTSTYRLGVAPVPKLKSASTIDGKRDRKSELHWLAIAGDHEKISDLLQQQSRPKRRTSTFTISRTETALDVNAQDKLGRSALHWAAARGEVECAKLLAPSTKPILHDKDGWTPLHEAVIRRHNNVVEVLLQNGHSADIRDKRERTVLHWAAEYGNREVVRMLVEKGLAKTIVNLIDKEHDSALHRAARNGYKIIIEELVQCGADILLKNMKGHTAFSLAVEKGRQEAAMFLLQNKDFKIEDREMVEILVDKFPSAREELLIWAAARGHEAVVKLLLEKGANVDTADEKSQTPLSYAAAHGHEGIVKLLLATEKVDVDSKDKDSRTPLSRATARGHEGIIKLLVTGQVDVISDR
jgi:ankyrin repeat protein